MPQLKAEAHPRVVFGGDVMLGRLVKEEILARGPAYPLGSIAPFMRAADLTIVNLECAITSRETVWEGEAKAFYFGAPPAAVESLVEAGVDLVSLANNHSLDFGRPGLVDTLALLRERGIAVAGAGRNVDEALTPAVVDRAGIRFGMAAFCDHQGDFAAGPDLPGIAFLDLDDEPAARKRFQESIDRMRELGVEWPILSLHWGPNMVWKPSRRFVRLAHDAIDMGYAALFGHSAHIFHGIEVYKGRPIFYSTGDLVDDYAVDPEFENDRQLLFEVSLSGLTVRGISLRPVIIEDCRTAFAVGREFDRITRRAVALCADMDTLVRREDNRLIVASLEGAHHETAHG
jgi:poly-gamma-glutamate synthesis protein (capsule biosynthesis protein)